MRLRSRSNDIDQTGMYPQDRCIYRPNIADLDNIIADLDNTVSEKWTRM